MRRIALAGALSLGLFGPREEAAAEVLEGPSVSARLSREGVSLGGFSMRLAAFGRDARAAMTAVGPTRDGDVVHYHRDEVDEWYRRDEHGIEQGFTIARSPGGSGRVTLDLDVSGAKVRAGSFTGVDIGGVHVDGLSVVDADGKALLASLTPTERGMQLSFDDRGARYPVVVDPYYAVSTPITPSGKGGTDASCTYGWRIRSAGNRIFLGMPCNANSAVYVFRWNGSALVEDQRITPPETANDFGKELDIEDSGLRLVVGAPANNKVFAYTSTGGAFTLEATVPAPETTTGFGTSIAYAPNGGGGDLAVYATYNAIYTFSRTGTTYSYVNKITSGTGGIGLTAQMTLKQRRLLVVNGSSGLDEFAPTPAWTLRGSLGSLGGAPRDYASSGSTAIFGTKIFAFDGTNWALQHTASGLTVGNVAINGNYAVFLGSTVSGPAHFYERVGSTWTQYANVFTANTPGWTGLIDKTRMVGAFNFDATFTTIDVTRANGAACTAANQCTSNNCVEGVCCDTACSGGTCVSCLASRKGTGSDGTCGNVIAGLPGKGGCTNAGTICGPDGKCNGSGSCRAGAPVGTSCGATMCSAGNLTGPSCNGSGSCVTAPVSCAPFVCKDGTSCFTACSDDSNCAAPNVCVSGVCRAKLPNGSTTTAASKCVSGFAADGVCCDTACDSSCLACTAAKTGGADGTCAQVKTGTDPDGECKARCMGATVLAAGTCDGAGKCTDGAPMSCAPYGCESGACKTKCFDDSDCAGAKCTGGVCGTATPDAGTILTDGGAPLVTGGPFSRCSSGSECSSGFCVEGVCCDSACDSTCYSCALPFAPGRCSIVPSGLDPRKQCGAGKSCHETCDGTGACIAVRPGDQCAPARCTDGSHGVGPAVCPAADSACPTTTAPFDCGPYACVTAFGACATRCLASIDCAPGFTCDGTNGQCIAVPPAEDDGGCAMAPASGKRFFALTALLALATALGRRRRAR